MVQCCPKEERNFAAVLKLLNDAKTGEQGLDALDKLFGEAKIQRKKTASRCGITFSNRQAKNCNVHTDRGSCASGRFCP